MTLIVLDCVRVVGVRRRLHSVLPPVAVIVKSLLATADGMLFGHRPSDSIEVAQLRLVRDLMVVDLGWAEALRLREGELVLRDVELLLTVTIRVHENFFTDTEIISLYPMK